MPPFSPDRRRRRNRRLTALGLTLVVLIGLFVSLGLFMRSRTDTAARQRVLDSVVAYEQQDYTRVIELLEDSNTNTNTIRVTAGDPVALWRYVVSRRAVERPNFEHYQLLFPALQQVVALDPGNLEAGYLLLELLMADNRNTEALDIAGRLITAHPDEADLFRIRYAVNMRLGRDAEALVDALAASEAEPLDVRTQMDVATLMQKLRYDATDFHQRAVALHEQHPEDPRAEVILARGLLLMGNLIEAQPLLTQASERDAPDDVFVQVLIETLDRLDRFEESYAYLRRNVGPGLDGPLKYEVYFRDFEAENYPDVISRAATLSLSEAHPNIIALAAISHHRMGNTEQTQQHLAQLQGQADEPLAQHWYTCLTTMWQEPRQPTQYVAVFAAACKDNPRHAYLHYFLADAYREFGELESAVAQLQVTRTYRTTWSRPFYLEAEMLLALGRNEEAATAALAALRRRPTLSHATAFGVAQARVADINEPREISRALTYIDEKVQAVQPNEPRTYAAAVELLARAGQRDEAISRIRSAIQQDPPIAQDGLLALATISQAHGLGLESALYTKAREAYGADPRVVLEQATALAQSGSNEEAIALFQSATPSPATRPWRVAEAQLLERLNEPGAIGCWVRLADDFPLDLEVQRIALASVGVRREREFADRTIQRLKSLGGADSVGWKIERARYLIGSDDPAADVRAAEALLKDVILASPERVEPYRLLSQCQLMQGDDDAAKRTIEQAAHLDPGDMRIQFQLGLLQHRQRQYPSASRALLRVARNEQAPPSLRFDALVLLSQQDEVETLIPILEAMRSQYVAPDEQKVLLARLYIADGRGDDADALCELMLQDPTPPAIAFVSEHYWRTGRREESQRVIDLLDTVEMPDAVRHTILGQHAARQEQAESALEQYRSAAQSAPDQPELWERLVVLSLVLGQPQTAITDANLALQHHPGDPGMRAIADNADLLNALVGDPRFRAIAASIVGDPANREVGLRTLRIIADAARPGSSTAAVARELSALATANPGYLQLQNLTAQFYSDLRQYERAAEIASNTMISFPADGTSARMATLALTESRQWRQAISASQDWARRVPSQKQIADTYLCAAQRNLGRVEDALKTIEPYLPAAQAEPSSHQTILSEYATCLAQLGRTQQAWDVIAPNLAASAGWRDLARTLGETAVPDTAATTQWFDAIANATPSDAPQERLALTQSIFNAGLRLGSQALVDRARAMIEQATQSADASSAAWFLRAHIADRSGDLAQAEASYRRVLQLEPDLALAKNNLAMVLAVRGRDLDEAVRLAQQACASQPQNPNLQDTLAHVFSRAGKHEDALRTIEVAIQLDRENAEWVRTKANLLEAAGRDDEANELRQRRNLIPDVE